MWWNLQWKIPRLKNQSSSTFWSHLICAPVITDWYFVNMYTYVQTSTGHLLVCFFFLSFFFSDLFEIHERVSISVCGNVSICNVSWFVLYVAVCSCGSASESSQTCLWSQSTSSNPSALPLLRHQRFWNLGKKSSVHDFQLLPEIFVICHTVPGVTIFNPLIYFFLSHCSMYF